MRVSHLRIRSTQQRATTWPPVSQTMLLSRLIPGASTAARLVFCVSTNLGGWPLFSFVSVLAITLVLFFVVAVSARAMLGR